MGINKEDTSLEKRAESAEVGKSNREQQKEKISRTYSKFTIAWRAKLIANGCGYA